VVRDAWDAMRWGVGCVECFASNVALEALNAPNVALEALVRALMVASNVALAAFRASNATLEAKLGGARVAGLAAKHVTPNSRITIRLRAPIPEPRPTQAPPH
jgi:hypothetical protein